MEKDIVEAIETAASTNIEGNENNIFPVKHVDEDERFQDGYGDGESLTIRYRYNNNKSGSSFFLRERRPAHLVGINVLGEMGRQTEREAFIRW